MHLTLFFNPYSEFMLNSLKATLFWHEEKCIITFLQQWGLNKFHWPGNFITINSSSSITNQTKVLDSPSLLDFRRRWARSDWAIFPKVGATGLTCLSASKVAVTAPWKNKRYYYLFSNIFSTRKNITLDIINFLFALQE